MWLQVYLDADFQPAWRCHARATILDDLTANI